MDCAVEGPGRFRSASRDHFGRRAGTRGAATVKVGRALREVDRLSVACSLVAVPTQRKFDPGLEREPVSRRRDTYSRTEIPHDIVTDANVYAGIELVYLLHDG